MNGLMSARNLCGGYQQKPVIKKISFDIYPGDFLGIIGPNGSGKSTLLRLLSRGLTPQSGSLLFQDEEIRQIPLKQFCRKVAFVSQDTFVHFPFTVQEITLMGRIPHLHRLQKERVSDLEVVEQALTYTNTLQFKNRLIDQLSAGERQRVLIAKALAQEPALLFLDEPTSHLDIGYQVQILGLLRRLNKERNLTVVIVLHDLNLASEYCSRLLLLNDGALYREGPPEDVLTYQNIESVYKTLVLVHVNPVSKKPYIVLVTQ